MFLLLLLLVCLLGSLTRGELVSTSYEDYNKGILGHRPFHAFYSSGETSPVLQVNTWNQTATAGGGSHIFLRHDGPDETAPATPLVLAARDLSAVYMNRSFEHVFGTRVQEDRGRRYLTFWEGRKGHGVGSGYGLAFDDNYRLRYKVSVQGLRTHADLHEFAFTGHGTVLVIGVDSVKVSTETWPGWKGSKQYRLLDAVFQELDLETNEVLFSWRATDHIDPMDSYEPKADNWDAYHMNSIQKTEAGNYLISIRHTHSIHLVSGTTGAILWTLGGKRNDFLEPVQAPYPAASVLSFAWQHHARFVPHTNETQLTLFDNHVLATTHGVCAHGTCSRGLHVALDLSPTGAGGKPTVRFLTEYLHPAHLQAQSQGSLQVLLGDDDDDDDDNAGAAEATTNNNNRVLVGWGRCPTFTEHDAATGATLLDVQFSPWHSAAIADALDNYRAYRMDWVAEPWWDPAMAVRARREGASSSSRLDVYLSWNGATEVREWVVRGLVRRGDGGAPPGMGHEERQAAPVLARGPRTGFETRLNVTVSGVGMSLLYMWAEALDAEGKVLRETDVMDFSAASAAAAVGNNATVIPFTDDGDFEEKLAAMLAASERSWRWVFVLGGVVVGLAAVVGGGMVVLTRCRVYDRLDDRDLDLEGESDVDDEDFPVGVDFLRDDQVSEPWQEFSMYAPRTGTGHERG